MPSPSKRRFRGGSPRARAKFGDEDARKLCAEMRRRAPVTIRRNARVCSSARLATRRRRGVATSGKPRRSRNISKRRRPRPRRPRHPRPRRPRLFRILRARARRRVGVHGGSSSRRVFGLAARAGWFEVRSASHPSSQTPSWTPPPPSARRGNLRASGRFWICARGTRRFWRWRLDSRARATTRDFGAFDFEVHCFDVDERRLRHLRAATARGGAETVSTRTALICARWRIWAAGTTPCSRTCPIGALRRFPSLRWEIDERKPRDGTGRDGDMWGWRGDGEETRVRRKGGGAFRRGRGPKVGSRERDAVAPRATAYSRERRR